MKDVMIDFETLGRNPDAPVVQIGACYFDRKTGEIGKTFYMKVDPVSAVKSGAIMDIEAIQFWLEQSDEARQRVFSKTDAQPIKYAFEAFNDFLGGAQQIWSHATFDFVILQATLRRLGIKPRVNYKSARDIRTLQDLADYPAGQPRSGVHHDALDDCKFQVSYCVAAFNKLGIK